MSAAAIPQEVRLSAAPPEVIVRVMMTLDRAADDFLGDCRRRGWSERTIDTYRRTYDELCDRLPVDHDISKITADDLRRFLAKKSHLAPGTVAGVEAHLASLFKWLASDAVKKIAKDPMAGMARTRRRAAEDLDVKTVSTDDVRRMMFAAQGWSERICMGVLVYTGCRRRAAAMLRLSDYDRARGRLRFHEKGGKTIWKPVPDELDSLLEAALAAGVYESPRKELTERQKEARKLRERGLKLEEIGEQMGTTRQNVYALLRRPLREVSLVSDPYLIPNKGVTTASTRSDRFIWQIVKDVAHRAGVGRENAHTHAMRAAFACFYLESNPGDSYGLQMLMGHSNPATTQIYLRKLDKEKQMEPVRSLSWGVSMDRSPEVVV